MTKFGSSANVYYIWLDLVLSFLCIKNTNILNILSLPFGYIWFSNWFENDSSSTHVLVFDQFLSMVAFFMGILKESFGKSMKGHIVPFKIGSLKSLEKYYEFPAIFLNIKRPFWKKESHTTIILY